MRAVEAGTPRAVAARTFSAGTATVGRYLRQRRAGVLAPTLRPGQVVVRDNRRIHQDRRVRRVIEAAGGRPRLLPPYSPDFTPLELAYAKVEAASRKVGARARDALDAAIDRAVATVTPYDARAFFSHCGSPLAQGHRTVL